MREFANKIIFLCSFYDVAAFFTSEILRVGFGSKYTKLKVGQLFESTRESDAENHNLKCWKFFILQHETKEFILEKLICYINSTSAGMKIARGTNWTKTCGKCSKNSKAHRCLLKNDELSLYVNCNQRKASKLKLKLAKDQNTKWNCAKPFTDACNLTKSFTHLSSFHHSNPLICLTFCKNNFRW